MNVIEHTLALMFVLIFLYLILFNRDAINTIIGGIGSGVTQTTRTLQGN